MASNTEGGHTMSYEMTRPSNVWQAGLKRVTTTITQNPNYSLSGELLFALATESRTSGIFEKLSDLFEGNF